ncbi:cGMP-dependent 3',5'-cyclic phosphodiesterase-like isoform X2 [Acropora palmata]|uniref:cGMP-dependent 3',5'-cyclic phosphodiesterase-like isoform X2 n=1 Tax=Acropora palmata TaxID=6131 RepID=UPI003DA038FA
MMLKRSSQENRGEAKRCSIHLSVPMQEALSCLTFAGNLKTMAERAERTVHLLIPKVIDTIVFVISPESDELEALGRSCIDATKLPLQGIVREAIDNNKTVIKATVGTEDPIVELLPSAGQLKSTQRVILSPLQKDGKLVAFIVVVCIISGDTLSYLDYIEQQILQSYHHITERRRYVYEFEWQKAFLEFFSKSYEREVGPLSRKIGEFLQTQTNAETSAILILDHTAGELHNKESSNSTQEKRIEVSGSIFEEVIQSKTKLTVFNIGEEKKYRNDLQKITDCSVHSMLCVPIVSIKTGIVIAVACVFNKKLNKGRFSSSEEDNAVFCCENIAAHLEHTLEWEREMVIKRQQEHLLKVAKNLFTLVDDVSVLLSEIMTEARKLTNAERCSVFLWDKERDELVAKVFDGEIPNDGTSINGKEPEVRIPVTQGIVGCVATTGKMLNIKDAYSHPLFYKGLDEKTGFRTRNILCFPIKDEEEVIGVAQLCNKINGSCFTKFDEDLTRAFAIYCGVSIFHSLLYKNAKEAYNRSRLSSEMMIYHMTVTQSEVDLLFSKKICSTKEIHPEFCLFSSTPRNILQDSMIPACLCMFEDLGMIEKWKIPKEVLVRFLLMVRKGYRNPPYHNWIHAFTVAHFCYLLFKNARITHQLRDIELLALFVACLCHDIDHRGTTNSFQVSSGSTLAALYSSKGSVLERHHFAQTMCILNSEGCNIFKNLTGKDYKDVFILIRDIILATDLAHHLRILQDLRKMAEHGFDSDSSDHRKLLLFLLMTASDLSDQTKNWEGTRGTAGLIYSEFFSQGDKEKHMGLTPMEMMDRERAVIPKLQIDFLDAIALPVYRLLSSLLPETQEVLETVLSNRQKWQKAQEDGDYVYRPVATSDKEIQLTVNGSVPDTCQ